jgi:putative GTP pyrophosphokinase
MNIFDFEDENMEELRRMYLKYKFALAEVETKVNIIYEEYNLLRDYNPIEHVKTRLKKPKSILAKLQKKGIDLNLEDVTNQINDIAGIRIICSFEDDIHEVAQVLMSQDDLKIISVKDYVTNKKENGYQSYHILVSVPVFMTQETTDMIVEIQIRTSAMDFWASLEHKISYKYKGNVPEDIREELRECAELSSELDSKMHGIREKLASE